MRLLSFLCVLICAGGAASAQTPDDPELRTAFSLSSSEVFTSKGNPAFYLTFRHLTQLDFRVYRVRDAAKFFAGLRDPHQLGGDDVPVPTERSWIERIADWKRRQRGEIRMFFREQVSYNYRTDRRAARDRQEVAQRVTLNQNTFAQVPLLNPDQLVSGWREMLPDLRDPELRRIPLSVSEPGVYVVEAVSGLLRAYTVVIVSDIGLITKVAPGQMLVFAAHRLTGDPQAGCEVQVLSQQNVIARGTTNGDGVLDTPLPEGKAEDLITVARCGGQVIASDPGSWYLNEPPRQLVGYVYTDKPIYRPGHTAHVKAVLRWRERDALLPFDRATVELAASDVNDKVVFRQSLQVDAFGSVHAALPVPPTAALGHYTLRIATGDQQASGSFEVQEYRRPEFEVSVSPTSRFVVQGQEIAAAVQARYYFGQPVAHARVRYVVNRQQYYSPYRWDDGFDGEERASYFYGQEQNAEGELRLDAQGRGEIRLPTNVADDGRDYTLRIEAQVTDASSREVSGSSTVHVTFGPFLITTQVSGYVFRAGQTITTSIRAVDYTGNARASVPVAIVLDRISYPSGYYANPTATRIGETSATLDANGHADVQLTLGNQAGTYRVRTTADYEGRQISNESWVWVAGELERSEVESERYLEMIADKKTYAPGETARLILRGEQVSGPVLATKEGQHVSWHRVLRLNAADPIEVPIDPGDVGDVYVSLAYMRDGRLYRADRRLAVPAVDRTLQITLTADRPVAKPQEPGLFTVAVTNAAGAPVIAQVSLGVIDEAVYAVRPDDTTDPVRFFYRRDYSRVGTTFSRDYYFTGFSGSERLQLARRKRRPFSLADFKGDKEVQPQVRKEFPDAIYWIGDLVTDVAGNAKVSIKYPDALTTWRLTARAVTTDTLAGTSVARTTTTKDLIVRVITPRFLTEGDQVVLPTIVHNYLEEPKDTAIQFEASGLQTAAGTTLDPVSGSIAAGGERRDNWRFAATTTGTAVVTAAATTDAGTDAVELSVPVLPYGLRREEGSSGTLFDAGEHSGDVTIPAASNPSGRSVRVSLAPSMAGSLLGALDFLTSYPYGCTEQTLSSFLPNLVVTRALAQLKLAPSERLTVLDRQVDDGLKRLYDYQHDDGGWGWWKTDPNHPFMTAYALYGLDEAKRAGYRVDQYRLDNAARALAAMYAENPRAEPDLKAYMAFVLGRAAGDAGVHNRSEALNELWSARDRMSAYGRALLLLALDDLKDTRGDELASALMAEAQAKGDLIWWTSERDPLLFDFADTSVEATATAVRALARRDPRNPQLDRAVRWLMLNRSGGYWYTTKQTAMALYGLLELLQARNETPQTFSADVYVNGTLAGTQTFTPASLVSPDPVVITAAARDGANTVRIVKRGGGTLYWSATGVYFDTQAAEARRGNRQLAITRHYAVLTPVTERSGNIVYREEPFQGQIAPGDVLTVRITAAGSSDWRYLVIEDPLPAGVEAIQDTTAYPMERPARGGWWYGSRVEYRDNKTVFFQETFDRGRYEYVYLVKAISSGEFRAVPAQIVPMYVPGIAASSEPLTVVVTVLPEGSR
jgi:alpha-2-macroglobulin